MKSGRWGYAATVWLCVIALLAATAYQWVRYDRLVAKASRKASPVALELGLHPHGNRHVGPVTASTRIVQTFVSPADELRGVELFISTFLSRIETPYTFRLFESSGVLLREVKLKVSTIADNAFFPIAFETIGGARGKLFAFTITPEKDPVTTPLTLQLSPPGIYEDGVLLLNGEERAEDIVFRPVRSFGTPLQKIQTHLRIFSIPLALLTLLLTLIAYRAAGARAIYVLIVMVGIYHVVATPPYSILDEGAHFDVINALYKERRLPLVTDPADLGEMRKLAGEIGTPAFSPGASSPRYEAVQPPLYYGVGALLAGGVACLTDSVAVRFYSLRLLSIPFLLLTAWLLMRTYEALVTARAVRRNELLLFTLLVLVLLSPAFLFVLTPLTNDQLLIPLATFFFYLLIGDLLGRGNPKATILLLALTAGGMILTKLTAAYLAALAAVVLLVRRGVVPAALYSLLTALVTAPWFAFNRMHYGAWTGIKGHLEFVRPIANPQGTPIPVEEILARLPEFFAGFLFVPAGHQLPLMMVHFVAVALVAAVFFHLAGALAGLGAVPAPKKAGWPAIRLLLLASLILNYVYLIFGTAATGVWAVYPRYMYLNATAAVLLALVFFQRVISRPYQPAAAAALLVCWAVSLFDYLRHLS